MARQAERAQRRYPAAIKVLTPAVQVNMADRQVNIAGSGSLPPTAP